MVRMPGNLAISLPDFIIFLKTILPTEMLLITVHRTRQAGHNQITRGME